MPRVIAGEAKGRRLKVPKGQWVRPTPSRVREALFSILGERVDGARVLDLYCGSGALGIEALSRGAERAVFVDTSPRALDCTRDNLITCGFETRGRCVRKRLPALDRSLGGPFSVIFSDPPYEDDPFGRLCEGLATVPGLVADNAIWAHEVASRRPLDQAAGGELWRLVDSRRYGDTTLWLFERMR